MPLSDEKKLEYIQHILEDISNGSIEDKENSVLLEVAVQFIEEIREKSDD